MLAKKQKDDSLLKKRNSFDDNWLKKERFEFLPLKSSGHSSTKIDCEKNNDDSRSICHQCKFIGKPEYFFKCTKKFLSNKIKYAEDIKKNLFNIKNGLSFVCDKKFCLSCVKSYYNYTIKKGDPKAWVCPFCTVR